MRAVEREDETESDSAEPAVASATSIGVGSRRRTRARELTRLARKLDNISPKQLRIGFVPSHLPRKPRSIESVKLEFVQSCLTRNNPNFRNRVGLAFDTWMKYVCLPVGIRLFRQKAGRGPPHRLSLEMRIFRVCLLLRGESIASLVDMFGQTKSALTKDWHKIIQVMALESDRWVKPIQCGSKEYHKLRGAGNFVNNPNAIYAMDGCVHQIDKPITELERQFFSMKEHIHCVKSYMAVDGFGICRFVIGPVAGLVHEKVAIEKSRLYQETNGFRNLLEDGDKILYDGLFKFHLKHCMDAPYSGVKRKARSKEERARDLRIRRSRIIVEHFFSRVKVLFPVCRRYLNLDKRFFPHVLRTCVMLTNISAIFEIPMRRIRCTPEKPCWACRHLKDESVWKYEIDSIYSVVAPPALEPITMRSQERGVVVRRPVQTEVDGGVDSEVSDEDDYKMTELDCSKSDPLYGIDLNTDSSEE